MAKTLINELMSEHEQPLRYFTPRYDTAYQATSELPEQSIETDREQSPTLGILILALPPHTRESWANHCPFLSLSPANELGLALSALTKGK